MSDLQKLRAKIEARIKEFEETDLYFDDEARCSTAVNAARGDSIDALNWVLSELEKIEEPSRKINMWSPPHAKKIEEAKE